jgi:hypothetical protein
MEKRTVTIEITIDPNAKPGPSAAHTNVQKPNRYWLDIVPTPEGHPGTMAENLAHELGHIVGDIFGTPASKGDIRGIEAEKGDAGHTEMLYNIFGAMPEKAKKSMVDSEAEAWELGKLMYPIKQETIDRSLGTYKRINTFESFSG